MIINGQKANIHLSVLQPTHTQRTKIKNANLKNIEDKENEKTNMGKRI